MILRELSRNSHGNVQIWGYGGCGARPIPPNLGDTPAIPRDPLRENHNKAHTEVKYTSYLTVLGYR